MKTKTVSKILDIKNDNNKLSCYFFSHIHFAPRQAEFRKVVAEDGKILEAFVSDLTSEDFEKVFIINNGMETITVQLHDLHRLKFKNISSVYTLLSNGKEEREWKADFITKYPNVTVDTDMAIYFYKRIL